MKKIANLQDLFLLSARRNRTSVTVFLVNGFQMRGGGTGVDSFVGFLESDGKQLIIAEVPQAEMFKYATDLRSMTQAKGAFKMNFERYEEVPQAISSKIIEAHKADLADAEEIFSPLSKK